jgi:hypothetical protein
MAEQDTGFWVPVGRLTLDGLRAEFPGWTITRAVSGLYYANRPAAPDAEPSGLIMGEDPEDLRDMIKGWLGRQAG